MLRKEFDVVAVCFDAVIRQSRLKSQVVGEVLYYMVFRHYQASPAELRLNVGISFTSWIGPNVDSYFFMLSARARKSLFA